MSAREEGGETRRPKERTPVRALIRVFLRPIERGGVGEESLGFLLRERKWE